MGRTTRQGLEGNVTHSNASHSHYYLIPESFAGLPADRTSRTGRVSPDGPRVVGAQRRPGRAGLQVQPLAGEAGFAQGVAATVRGAGRVGSAGDAASGAPAARAG